jgi:hypothetical protein
MPAGPSNRLPEKGGDPSHNQSLLRPTLQMGKLGDLLPKRGGQTVRVSDGNRSGGRGQRPPLGRRHARQLLVRC